MYGIWFAITFFWVGLVALVIALAALASPLFALAIGAAGILVFLVFAGLVRSRPGAESERRHDPGRRGAPVSGEGSS
jgi:membrane protein implicated in regulation of membrane protease activity